MVVCFIICIVLTGLSALGNLGIGNLLGLLGNIITGAIDSIGLYALKDSEGSVRDMEREIQTCQTKILAKEKNILALKMQLGEELDVPDESQTAANNVWHLDDGIQRNWPVL